jgi:hypothetical protein
MIKAHRKPSSLPSLASCHIGKGGTLMKKAQRKYWPATRVLDECSGRNDEED